MPPPPAARPRTFDINEVLIEGSTQLSAVEVETAVYPFLGPGRVLEDVERARAALEKAYADRGYTFVWMDVRGRGDSDGEFQPYVNEGRDGFDAVEWAAAQPWSSGEVALWGW